jgi:hypothetical protein
MAWVLGLEAWNFLNAEIYPIRNIIEILLGTLPEK